MDHTKFAAYAFLAALTFTATTAFAGLLDKAWIKGTTDKNPVSYKVGEEMVFTLTPMGLDGEVPAGEYSLSVRRSDDFSYGADEKFPFDVKPFVYKTKIDRPGFVRIAFCVSEERIKASLPAFRALAKAYGLCK